MSLIKRHTQDIPVTISADTSYQPQHPMFQNAEPRSKPSMLGLFSKLRRRGRRKKKFKVKNISTILLELVQFVDPGITRKISKDMAIKEFNSLINDLKKDSVNSLKGDVYKGMMKKFLSGIGVTIKDNEKFINKIKEIKDGINAQ